MAALCPLESVAEVKLMKNLSRHFLYSLEFPDCPINHDQRQLEKKSKRRNILQTTGSV